MRRMGSVTKKPALAAAFLIVTIFVVAWLAEAGRHESAGLMISGPVMPPLPVAAADSESSSRLLPPRDGDAVPAPQSVPMPPPRSALGGDAVLRLAAHGPDGRGVVGVFAEVGAKQAMFSDDGLDSAVTDRSGPSVDGQTGTDRCRQQFVSLGLAYFDSILPGVECTARFVDRTGREMGRVNVSPFDAGEVRIIDVPVAAASIALSAHVVDRQGQPVAHAQVVIGPPGSSREKAANLEFTDSDGDARLGLVMPGVISVRVVHFGCEVLTLLTKPVPDDGRLELGIDRGRSIRVRCVGLNGAPVAADSVQATDEWTLPRVSRQLARSASDDDGSTWYAEAMPSGELCLRALIAAGAVTVRATSDDIRLVVPDRVPVEVTWNDGVPTWADAVWVLNDTGESSGRWIQPGERADHRLRLALLPGRYRVGLSGHPSFGPDIQWASAIPWCQVAYHLQVVVPLTGP